MRKILPYGNIFWHLNFFFGIWEPHLTRYSQRYLKIYYKNKYLFLILMNKRTPKKKPKHGNPLTKDKWIQHQIVQIKQYFTVTNVIYVYIIHVFTYLWVEVKLLDVTVTSSSNGCWKLVEAKSEREILSARRNETVTRWRDIPYRIKHIFLSVEIKRTLILFLWWFSSRIISSNTKRLPTRSEYTKQIIIMELKWLE